MRFLIDFMIMSPIGRRFSFGYSCPFFSLATKNPGVFYALSRGHQPVPHTWTTRSQPSRTEGPGEGRRGGRGGDKGGGWGGLSPRGICPKVSGVGGGGPGGKTRYVLSVCVFAEVTTDIIHMADSSAFPLRVMGIIDMQTYMQEYKLNISWTSTICSILSIANEEVAFIRFTET